jgi:tRNA pseudouridine38-40 synthase
MWKKSSQSFWTIALVLMKSVSSFKSVSDIRYVARVAYDGTPFRGFQAQSIDVPTVQSTLLKALQAKLGPRTSLTGASRTDVGVHARGNCIHFDVPQENIALISNLGKFEFSLNRMLPPTIRLFDLSVAPSPSDVTDGTTSSKFFHATSSALGKKYTYTFCTAPYLDPIKRTFCSHYKNIDVSLLEKCLSLFVGTHNFIAFANSVPQTKLAFEAVGKTLDTFRTVESIELHDLSQGYYQIDFRIQSAMYKMIRNIVGTSMLVAGGKMSLSQLKNLIDSAPGREYNLGLPAPPQGLVLEHVYYEKY